MAFSNNAPQSTQPKNTTLVGDTALLCERLNEIRNRVRDIGDKLHGPEPRDASGSAGVPEPMPHLRRHTDMAFSLITAIESELTRVEAQL